MNLSETDIIQLERYWNGQLEPSEQAEMEKRLSEDSDFREAAADWHLLITDAFMPPKEELIEAAEIKKRLLSYREEAKVDAKKTVTPQGFLSVRWVAIGLAVAAAILLLLWLNPLNSMLQEQRPSADFFAHLSRDNANLSDDSWQMYDQKKYAQAYPALLADVEAGGDSLNLIYASVAAIGSGQAEKAIQLLEPLANAKSWNLYQAEIQWYLALAYLDDGQIEKTKRLLDAMIKANKEYAKEAEKLMQKIK